MLDCQLYELNAGDHHLTNVLLQTAAAILLFLALRQMTGFLWRSAFVAAVFAIHPLRVESVVWVSERKDVLCGLFFMLTLWAYVRYVQCARSQKPGGWYLMTLFFFALGLMSKPTAVPLPLVLLLLDYWPLKRFDTSKLQRLFIEKIPLLLLSLAGCIPTLLAERTGIQPLDQHPLSLRIENAIVSYAIQMERMVYPVHLAVFYPYPTDGIPLWEVALAGILLAGICALAWAQRRTRPWLLVGWLWYLVMLAPNIGFIQVGDQAQADRHTYLPQIGLYLMLAWTAADGCARWRHRHVALGGLSAIILVALIACARTQASYWRNSESLWTHALACTSGNSIAHNHLGNELAHQGKLDEAILQFRDALDINPDYADAGNNLGAALLLKGNVDGAILHFQETLRINPDIAQVQHNLGNALVRKGDLDEAIAHFQKAVQLEPRNPKFQSDLAITLNNLAWSLATSADASIRDGKRAVPLGEQACEITQYQQTVCIGTLAAAYAEAGQFDDAVATARMAIANAQQQGETDLAQKNQELLQLYLAHKPYHQQDK
jgi:tetratricopeptide (TPR) repeat protein